MDANSTCKLRRKSRTLAMLASLTLTAAARAEAPAHKLMLAGYIDAPGGRTLIAGDYQGVIEQLSAHGFAYQTNLVAASANLCVAYIVTRQWRDADTTCDQAVASARLQLTDTSLWGKRDRDEQMALAYSNRAVLHRLEDNASGAASDLAMARQLAPDAEFVSHNLAIVASAKSAALEVSAATHR